MGGKDGSISEDLYSSVGDASRVGILSVLLRHRASHDWPKRDASPPLPIGSPLDSLGDADAGTRRPRYRLNVSCPLGDADAGRVAHRIIEFKGDSY